MTFDKHDLTIRRYIVTDKASSLDVFKAEALTDTLSAIESCAIKVIYTDDGVFKHFQVKFYSFKEQEYNEIDYESEVEKICNCISQFDVTSYTSNHYIYFNQSSLKTIDKAFEPLMWHLAITMQDQWQNFETEDLFQICRLCLCRLYKKGYCIHPGILKKTFVHEVLLSMRKNKNHPDIKIISLETPVKSIKLEGDLTVADTIEDIEYNNRVEAKERKETVDHIFDIINKIIVKEIGERRYQQLVQAHRNKCANGSQRMLIIRIRKILAKRGYDAEWLKKMLRGDV